MINFKTYMSLRYDSQFEPLRTVIEEIKKRGLISDEELSRMTGDIPELLGFQIAQLLHQKIHIARDRIIQEPQGLTKVNLQAHAEALVASLVLLNLALNFSAYLSANSLIFK